MYSLKDRTSQIQDFCSHPRYLYMKAKENVHRRTFTEDLSSLKQNCELKSIFMELS